MATDDERPAAQRQVYAEAARVALQLYELLDAIDDFEPFGHSIHDRDTYLGSVFYNLDEVIAELRIAASAPDAE